MDNIIRGYPCHMVKLTYPNRYVIDDFIEYEQMLNNEVLQANYKKWLKGINYKTNRKINIDGKVHKSLRHEFELKNKNKRVYKTLFSKLENINVKEYLLKTEAMDKEVYNKNKEVEAYNKKVDHVIKKMKKLTDWNDYVYFDSYIYGMPEIVDKIHKVDNCGGKMIFDYCEWCACNLCENWFGCGRGGCDYYKCDKCGYKSLSR